MTHLDDTYEGDGKHDDLVTAVALADEPLPYAEHPEIVRP